MSDLQASTCMLYKGNCLEIMPTLTPGSVAMVFADLPYASTSCPWDKRIDKETFWEHVNIAASQNAYAIFTANMRLAFDIMRHASVPFCYDLVYVKAQGMGHFSAKTKPLCAHENILVFGRGKKTYHPIMTTNMSKRQGIKLSVQSEAAVYGAKFIKTEWMDKGTRYPVSVVCPALPKPERGLHPTQKPVALLEWLIKTYTNPGDTVLDPVFGSCTTGVACARLGRNFIGIEKDAKYFQIGRDRVNAERAGLGLGEAVAHV